MDDDVVQYLSVRVVDFYFKKMNKLRNEIKDKPDIMSDIMSDFLTNTSIHGIPHLGAKDKNIIEKIWWAIGFILSITAGTYLMTETWNKWKENPVIVSFAQEHTSVWEIPFPAVTICPINKIQESEFNYSACYLPRVYNSESLQDIWNTTENNKIFWDVTLICNKDFLLPYTMLNEANNITDEHIIYNIKRVSPRSILVSFTWLNQVDRNGTLFFVDRITSEGLCFTFNGLGHGDMYTGQMKKGIVDDNMSSTGWDMENGYSTNNDDDTYPIRTSQAGLLHGLSFTLYYNKNQRSKYCDDSISAFKVILHNPAEVPRMSENYVLIPTSKKVLVAVTPKVIRTSKNLLDVPPHTRNCYFADEKNLRFFKVYTQYNCKTECLKNITAKHCGCVPFYLPRDNKTEICGPGRVLCLQEATDLYFKFENQLGSSKSSIKESEIEEFEEFQQCDCLASCDFIDYAAELTQADSIYEQIYSKGNEDKNPTLFYSDIIIFFKETQFLALERKELYGSTEFVAKIGGILGLCMGFSLLSLLEIVYYVTLRVWFKMYHRNKIYSEHNSNQNVVWIN